jgi:uroporphyrin-3 C-methyltransferase
VNEKTKQTNQSPEKSNQAFNKASNKASNKSSTGSAQRLTSTQPRKKILQFLRVVLGLVLIGAVTLSAYFMWDNWQERGLILRETDQALVSLDQLTNSLTEQSNALIAGQSQQTKQVEKLESKIDNLQLRINTQGQRMAELGSTTRSDWLLAEAVYLSRLANQRLQTERSVKNPLALLENVDLILKELDDESLLPVRRALVEDITALRLVKDVDRQGVYLELQAIANNLDALPLMDIPFQVASAKESSHTDRANEADVDKGFFYEIQSLVRVTKREKPIEPILQPTESALVKYNLSMMLEQAQIALLREEQVIFETSLAKADNYLSRFFQSSTNVKAVADRLVVLRQMSVQQQLPTINRTLEALETLLVTRQQRLTGANSTEVGPNVNKEFERAGKAERVEEAEMEKSQ